jgi:integral membrane protein
MTTPTRASKVEGAPLAFRVAAYVETMTFLLLLGSSLLFRVFDGPDFISIMGPVHGVAFLVYLVLVLAIRDGQGWTFWHTVLIIFLAAVPLGGFWAGSHLKNNESAPALP